MKIEKLIDKYLDENDNMDKAVMDKKMSGNSPDRHRKISKKVKDEDSEEAAPK